MAPTLKRLASQRGVAWRGEDDGVDDISTRSITSQVATNTISSTTRETPRALQRVDVDCRDRWAVADTPLHNVWCSGLELAGVDDGHSIA